jgi:hypothetical protein
VASIFYNLFLKKLNFVNNKIILSIFTFLLICFCCFCCIVACFGSILASEGLGNIGIDDEISTDLDEFNQVTYGVKIPDEIRNTTKVQIKVQGFMDDYMEGLIIFEDQESYEIFLEENQEYLSVENYDSSYFQVPQLYEVILENDLPTDSDVLLELQTDQAQVELITAEDMPYGTFIGIEGIPTNPATNEEIESDEVYLVFRYFET